MSKPVCTDCSESSVLISMLAPASSTKDAAICVTAKTRSRRLVLPVIRTLPLDRPNPCEVFADGSRGTNAKSTAAMIARYRSDPEHAGVDRQIERPDRESGGIASQDGHHRPRAQYAECRADAAEQQAFGQQCTTQRAGACAQRRTDGQLAFAPNGPRENQVGDVRARDDEDQPGGH